MPGSIRFARPLADLAAVAVVAVAIGGCSTGPTPSGSGQAAPAATTATEGTLPPAATAGPSAPTAAGPKACDLLTDADIQELSAVGVVKKEDDVLDTIYGNHCRWTLEVGEINLGIVSPGGREFYDKRLGILATLQPIEGLPAEIAVLETNTNSIFAVKGDTLVDLFTIAVGAPDEELVRRVLENLGQP